MRKRRIKFCHLEPLEARRLLAFNSLVISEFMAANSSTLVDEDGEYSDWLEIHNPTDERVQLEGWSLTDDAEDLNKWSLPTRELAAGDYQVVFASGKDRAIQTGELHTNFRLRNAGEYLALVGPEGIAQEFSPAYPRQSADVAFGLIVDQNQLIGPESSLRFTIPVVTDEVIENQWTALDFDASDWTEVTGSLGYELRKGLPNVGFEAGDFQDWSARGETEVVTVAIGSQPTQGEQQALLRTSQDAPTRFSLENFLGLGRFALDRVGNGSVTRGSVVKRELEVEAGSRIEFDWNFLTDEPRINGFDDFSFVSIVPDIGVIELASVADVEQPSSTSFARESGYQNFSYTFERGGTYTLGMGAVNSESRFNDSALLVDNLLVDGVGSLSDTFEGLIDNEVTAELSGQASSVWVRQEFDLLDPGDVSSVVVDTRYDDGLVVHLNGQQVIRRNAPTDLKWNSFAQTPRPNALAIESELITLPAGLLRAGKNVLSYQGLKATADDENFLLQMGLVATTELEPTPAYLPTASPGSPNLTTSFRVVEDVQFSEAHGFYDESFELTLTTATANAKVIYTSDGSVPTLTNGTVYDSPLTVDSTTVFRAAAFGEGFEASPVSTRSFLFVEDVLTQSRASARQKGFPNAVGQWDADYAMDQRIIGQNGEDRFGSRYADTIRNDLKSVPTLSIVMEMDDLFGSRGIYSNPTERGVEWERPTSVELIEHDGGDGFQIDAGIRIQGGISRFISSKNSLRLLFKEKYGASKLEYPLFGPENASTFDSISLRSSSGENLVGIHYIRDEFLRRSQLQTGNLSSHGTFMHLFINGLYWGMYNPVERIDGQFAANYFGGEKEDFDVLNAGDLGQEGVSPVVGSLDAWNTLINLSREVSRARAQQDKTAAYLRLQGRNPDGSRNDEWEVYLDVENYIDYLITNVYAKNGDWPIRNYYMSRRLGLDSTGFKFYVWDAEFTIDQGNKESIASVGDEGPGAIYQFLKESESFRVDFSDRVQKHFTAGGAYFVDSDSPVYDPERPENNVPAALYANIAKEVESPLVAESARWGDGRGHFAAGNHPMGTLFTRDERWLPVVNSNLESFFRSRSRSFLSDLRRTEFYRSAPEFSLPGGAINVGQRVEISARSGDIYYTLDGSDPRNVDGSVSPTALRGDVVEIQQRTTLKARLLSTNKWSAIHAAEYFTDTLPANSTNIKIAELNYNPHEASVPFGELDVDNDEFEFVELVNIADRPVDLTGARFSRSGGEGIAFEFGPQLLAPNQRLAVVRNREAFSSRFGDDVLLARGVGDDVSQWVYEGKLSNGGELISLFDVSDKLIAKLQFDDSDAWPERADGRGSSLELINLFGGPGDPSNYRSSSEIGGSPGVAGLGADNRVVINELLTNSDEATLDRIELSNTTPGEIDLSGWYLTDTPDDWMRHQIPQGFKIAERGFLVFDQNQFGFGLNAVRGDDLFLIQPDSTGKPIRFVDRVEFGATDPGVTLGRWPDGQGRLFPMEVASLGAENSGPKLAPIVITEIAYDPQDPDDSGPFEASEFEYVEIYNRSAGVVDLGDYSLDGSIEFSLPLDFLLQPGEAAVVVKFDPEQDPEREIIYRLAYSVEPSARLLGPMTGELGDETGTVRLERESIDAGDDPDRSQVLIDRVSYRNSEAWPINLNGTRQALTRLAPDSYGDFANSWGARKRTPGKTDFEQLSPGDFNGDGRVDVVDIDELCSAVLVSSQHSKFDLNRDGTTDDSDYQYLIRDILGVVPGDANLDGTFNSGDIVLVFQANEYEDGRSENSSWAEGDWNCDGEFNTADFVVAFQADGYATRNVTRAATPIRLPIWQAKSTEQQRNEEHRLQLPSLKSASKQLPLVQGGTEEKSFRIFERRSQPLRDAGLQAAAIDRFFEQMDAADQ